MKTGALYLGAEKCLFRVWAPHAASMAVRIFDGHRGLLEMERAADGCWEIEVSGIGPGTRYVLVIDADKERPDPASQYQPEGVEGPSAVVDHTAFRWEDGPWPGVRLPGIVLYELHVGTFTPGGTFEAVVPRLADLKDLGITAIEIMPVAQFPGERNWGYDGAFPYAAQNSYGGPRGLKTLVNEAHKMGFGVFLDVVYNHIGPLGNRLQDFGPYFSERYNGVWGRALNFDETGSDMVRDYFIENALYWLREFHIDGLRLDAVDAIFDHSARTFLEELGERTAALAEETGRDLVLTAENDRNDPRLIRPRDCGGYGIDAQWCDDFHHSLHSLLTGEKRGYYVDFGGIAPMVRSIRDAYVYQGEYSVFRGRRHGAPPTNCRPEQFIVFSQNHDQVGNRLGGTRLSHLVSFEAAKLAAACVLTSQYIPMLFMGEEYAESAPFLFFVDHPDDDLCDAVRRGRKQAMEAFCWAETPEDPADPATFEKSMIAWEKRESGRHAVMLSYYREIIRLRAMLPALGKPGGPLGAGPIGDDGVVFLRRGRGGSEAVVLFNFAETAVDAALPAPDGAWRKRLDSSDVRWSGPGSRIPELVTRGSPISLNPHCAVVFEKTAAGGA